MIKESYPTIYAFLSADRYLYEDIRKNRVFLVCLETEQKALGDLKGLFLQILLVPLFPHRNSYCCRQSAYMSILTLLQSKERNESYKALKEPKEWVSSLALERFQQIYKINNMIIPVFHHLFHKILCFFKNSIWTAPFKIN